MSYLLQTPTYYYFRIRVPKDLRSVLKRREIKMTLKTEDRRKAARLAAVYAVQCHELFERLRGQSMANFFPTSFKIAEIERTASGGFRLTGVETDGSEADGKALSDFIGKLAASPAPTKAKSMLLSEACAQFVAEQQALEPGSLYYQNDVPKHLELLVRIVGDHPVDEIGRSDALSYFDTLKKLPANLNKNPRFIDKSINQILKLGETPRAASTVNNAMICVSALFDWLTLYRHVPQDVFKDLRMEKPKGGRDRFDVCELAKIFSHSLFSTHDFKHAYRFWMPLIALHSGMRMNEILQLRPQDIVTEQGLLMMVVTEDGKNMSVKTDASVRRVPVHPSLLDIGFMRFIESRKEKDWLFDGLTIAKDGRRSAKASKWFSDTFRPSVGLKVKGKDFHSFRHTAIDDLKQSEASLHVIKALVGHADSLPGDDITFDRYGKQFNALILHKVIAVNRH